MLTPVSDLILRTAGDMLADVIESTDGDPLAKEAAKALMDKEKAFRKMPNVKPPRRQSFNVSETRDYRNEYQREYRAEHGNGD